MGQLLLWSVLIWLFGLQAHVSAAAVLSVTPISWNVIGLDSNNVSVGPNRYPVGARVCNTGDAAATNVKASIFLDGGVTNPYISIFGQTSLGVFSLPAGSTPLPPYRLSNKPANCADFYFLVDISRNSGAYSSRVSDTATPAQRNTQLYHIEATADGLGTVSTPSNRELYVEKLISQGRNSITQFSGPTNVLVGGTYTYTLDGTTAPGGYEQLEVFTNFPNNIFQITNVSTTYTSPSGSVNSSVYADACGWENNRSSTSYHNNLTCIGPANYTGAKAGDVIHTQLTVKILSAGTATVQSTINDFSGSSYHYNADFGDAINSVTITASDPVSGPDMLISKTHTPMSVGAGGTYTLSVSNGGGTATNGWVTVTDTLPTGLSPTSATGAGWTCTVVSQTVTCKRSDALAAGASYPNISIPTSVSANKPTLVTNTATVYLTNDGNPASTSLDGNNSNNSASDPTNITASVDVKVTKVQMTPTGGGTVADAGNVVYEIQVINTGTTAADGAVVADPAVSGFNVTSVTCSSSSNNTSCPTSPISVAQFQSGVTIASFVKNSTLTFTVTGKAVANAAYKITNSAYASPATGFADTNPADNVATATTNIQNPAPVATNDSANGSLNTPVTLNVTGNDTDTAPGTVDVSTVDLDPATTGTQTSYTLASKGTFTVDSSGNVTFTPVTGFTGSAVINYLVKDNVGAVSNTATITITVSGTNFACTTPVGVSSDSQWAGKLYTLTGNTLTTLTPVWTLAQGAFAVGRAPDGVVYYVGAVNGLLYYYNPFTGVGGNVRNTGNTANIQIAQPQTYPDLTSTVTRLAVAPNGTAYAVVGNGTVYSFPTSGRVGSIPTTTVSTVGQLQDPKGVAVSATDGGDIFFDADGMGWAIMTDLVSGSPTNNQSVLWKLDLVSMTSGNLKVATPIAAVTLSGAVSTGTPLNGIADTGSALIVTDNNGKLSNFDLGVGNLSGSTTITPTLYDLATCTYRQFRPVLTLTKTSSPTSSVQSNATVTYTITVKNTGTAPATNVKLSDPIPANTTYVTNSTTLNGTAQTDAAGAMPFVTASAVKSTGNAYVYPGATLAAGNTATVQFKVTVNSSLPTGSSVITNTASLSFDPYVGSSSPLNATAINNVTPLVNLVKTVRNTAGGTASTGTIQAGPKDVLEYCLTYRSVRGPAQNYILTDPLNSMLTFVPDAYGSGKDMQWTQYAADGSTIQSTAYLTRGSGDDQGTFGTYTKGGVTTQNTVQFVLSVMSAADTAGSSGQLCFQAKVN